MSGGVHRSGRNIADHVTVAGYLSHCPTLWYQNNKVATVLTERSAIERVAIFHAGLGVNRPTLSVFDLRGVCDNATFQETANAV